MHARACSHVHTSRFPPLSAIRVWLCRPLGAPQHLVSTWPGQAPGPSGRRQLGIWWEGVSEQPNSLLVGPPGAPPPQHSTHPEPPTAGPGRPPAPSLTDPAGPAWAPAWGLASTLHPLRMAWTRGAEPGWGVVQQHWPGARGSGLRALRPRGGPTPPAGPDPHTTDKPMVLKPRPHARGEAAVLSLYSFIVPRDSSLYHTPLNGVNFLIIYIKINIYKYI